MLLADVISKGIYHFVLKTVGGRKVENEKAQLESLELQL
jgi:hypothetical protein